jgi:hypothetical protein
LSPKQFSSSISIKPQIEILDWEAFLPFRINGLLRAAAPLDGRIVTGVVEFARASNWRSSDPLSHAYAREIIKPRSEPAPETL